MKTTDGLWAIAIALILIFAVALPAHAQVLPPSRGGTGTATSPTLGQVLLGQSNGTYAPVATSSLGLIANISAAYPIQYANGVMSLVFGTTTANTWSAHNVFSSLFATNASSTNATTTNLAVTGSFNFLGTIITNVGTWFNGLFDARLATKTTTDLAEGSNLYFTLNRVASAIAGTTTDALLEGSSNRYFTDARARSAISETITGIDYSSGTGVLSLASGYSIPTTATQADWDTAFGWGNHALAGYLTSISTSTVRGMFSEGAGLLYNAITGVFSLDTTGDWTGTFDGREGTGYLARANHTGTQLLSTISDAGLLAALNDLSSFDTDDLAEGSNLYFTNARADARISAQKGEPDGLATLDGGGKVPVSQLPNAIMVYQGTWNASTNSPTLADGSGSTGDVYRVSVAGTQNLGSGAIAFVVGDYAIYNGSTWEKADTTDAVSSINGFTGDVTLTTSNISEGSNLYYTLARWASALAGTTTDALAEGSTNRYFTDARARTALSSAFTSGAIPFGNGTNYSIDATNLAFDDAADRLTATNASTTNLSIGSLTGFLKGTSGAVSAVSSIVPSDISLTKGNFLVGNDAGVAQATSSIFVSSTGNIGIGTASPTDKLQVVDTSAGARNQAIQIHNASNTNDSRASIAFSASAAAMNTFIPAEIGYQRAGTGNAGLYFSVGSSASLTQTDRMVIDILGNVGIGTTTPASRLQVAANNTALPTTGVYQQLELTGSTAATPRLSLGVLTSAVSGLASGSGVIQPLINASGFTPLYLNPQGGNVGIGIGSGLGSADYKLDVRGNGNDTTSASIQLRSLASAGSTLAGAIFNIKTPTSSGLFGAFPDDFADASYADRIVFGTNSDASGIVLAAQTAGQDIRFFSGSATESMRIDSSGRVGVGTTTPGTILSIGSSTDYINLSNTATSTFSKGIESKGLIQAASGYFSGLVEFASTTIFQGLATFNAGIRVASETITDFTGFGLTLVGGALGLDTTGAADGECLKYRSAGPSIAWETCSDAIGFGGSGTDGALSISSGTTTIDLAGASFVTKNYTSISITGTGALAFTNPHASGTVIRLRSQGNVSITSTASPAIDVRALGATGGAGEIGNTTAAQAGTVANGAFGSDANAGRGNAESTTGGTAQTSSFYLFSDASQYRPVYAVIPGNGGGGGSNGDDPSAGNGGAGGRGGGALYVEVGGALNFTGTINASGSAGSQPGTSVSGAGYGGGGGGSAGMVAILYQTLTANSGTITATGGAGGTGGTGTGSGWNPGNAGSGAGSIRAAGGGGAVGAAAPSAGVAGQGLGAGGGGGGGRDASGAGSAGGAGGASMGGYVGQYVPI